MDHYFYLAYMRAATNFAHPSRICLFEVAYDRAGTLIGSARFLNITSTHLLLATEILNFLFVICSYNLSKVFIYRAALLLLGTPYLSSSCQWKGS